ncbi:hypothetical protein ROZALSC1DRAFT_29533 [Rozella allomycis CSF55]|uniref:Uncharacterized protein n=1 Tax=Rozella allomycis (strain CSF55) TaxID=988480 RepID=A0A075B360_ROZAC|nr:hypothetical protein O9G_003817 [Rozella allomycis CSF55]RKP18818.1 hypothetical protein ROZALSC1DRAFT_29533 [Rozella allomycis CSF55]|eukprot:EPZ35406.1 hypothetical protein O9G_003817 [Rozella allomycis CSF55]
MADSKLNTNKARFKPLNKEQRDKCYEAKDLYFKYCNSYEKEDSDDCIKLNEHFAQSCPESWVVHFKELRMREVEYQKRYDEYKKQGYNVE